MAKLLKKVTNVIAKVSDSLKEKEDTNNKKNTTIAESTDGSNGSWIGEGISPTTGKKTYVSHSSGGTSTNLGSYEDDLNRLTEAQRKSQIAQLKQARDKALANLDVQEQSIKPTYQNARNQASATSQSGARSFAEYLANRGLTNSGVSAQGELNRLSSLQNTLGGINTAEANAYRDIANQRTAVQNDYVAGVANANNAIAQEYYNNLLNYNQQQRAMVQQLQQQALGQYANDYMARRNELIAQGYSPNSLEVLMVDAARGNKMTNAYNNTYTPTNSLNRIYAGNWNANDLLMTGLTQEQAVDMNKKYIIDQELKAIQEREGLEREIAQQEFDNRIALGKLNNDILQTQYNINKPYYKPSDNSKPETITPSYSAQKNYIDNTFAIKDIYGNVTGYDKDGILQYVQSENSSGRLTDQDTINILYNYEMKDIADQLVQ